PRFSLDGVDELVEVGAEPFEVVGGDESACGSFVFPAFMCGIRFPQLLQNLVGHLVVPSSAIRAASSIALFRFRSVALIRSAFVLSARMSAAICFLSAASK